MSTASVQSSGHYASIPGMTSTTTTTTSSYPTTSMSNRYHDPQAVSGNNRYTNEQSSSGNRSSQQRGQRVQDQSNSNNAAYRQYYTSRGMQDDAQYAQSLPQDDSNITTTTSTSTYYAAPNTTLPYHTRNQSNDADQYDGAPVPPPRNSSQQQSSTLPVAPSSTGSTEPRSGTSRYTRHDDGNLYSQPGQGSQYTREYENARERSRDDTATTTGSGGRSRRKGPGTPDGPQRATSTRERGQQQNPPVQSRSEATMMHSTGPAPLLRENSEVIDRIIVSDPQVDVQRMQERVAEAQPQSMDSDGLSLSGLGLTSREGTEDDGRGPARRQDYSKSSSRRKDVQFGDYILGQTLGEGEFGKVKLGWKKDGSSQVAIKLIRKDTVVSNPTRLPKINREISILQDLTHPNIVRLHEKVETERHIGIILEYASGGELFDYILNHRYLKDPAAKRLFSQLVSGVGYLHKKGIVHRDLKLENLLLDQNRNIIITDFGFANTFSPTDDLSDDVIYQLSNREFVRKYKLDRLDANGMRRGDLMQTSCGSPCYAAPELVVSDSLYTGRKVDVWSCGVILYAMLAGYLPFDDDPANPEGDNINLLYKYITSTPLTFPEYVSPHARDLLRRILVPDPRKRADLFEVARHSWLSEYHHLVFQYTSSTTNINDINNSLLSAETGQDPPSMNRSASVREHSKPTNHPSPGLRLARTPEIGTDGEQESSGSRRERLTRHTLQPEYVAPQTHTARGTTSAATTSIQNKPRVEVSDPTIASTQPTPTVSKPLPQEPPQERVKDRGQAPVVPQKMAPPIRPARDVPRSVSESTGAFGTSASTSQNMPQGTRPSTQGSVTSASGPGGTRSDLRLPSRGSYGQPVAPSVATTNAQGRVTQPTKSHRAYNISGPISPPGIQNPSSQPMTQNVQPSSAPQSQKGHHRRSSTLSGLGERLFGRSSSVNRKNDVERQKNGRKYPPNSMKDPYPADVQPRMSTDSKRSISFGLGKKRSTDMESQNEKPGRRFSLIPASMSFKGLMGGNKESVPDQAVRRTGEYHQNQTYPNQTNANTYQRSTSSHRPGTDSQQEDTRPARINNFSRPPQAQYRQPQYSQNTAAPAPNDVYGGTGVYAPQDYNSHSRQGSQQLFQQSNQNPDGAGDYSRPSMQQNRPGRGVLTKPNRKFVDAYENEQGPSHHGGSSGAVKKVQDFFRRRGRARADSDYR